MRFSDCVHIPAAENIAGDLTTSPQRLLEQGQIKGLTSAQKQALDDGADLNRVVNARRNMATTQVEEIYRRSPNRADAVTALRRTGYLN